MLPEQDQLAATALPACGQTRAGPGCYSVDEKGAGVGPTYNKLHIPFWDGLALES